MNGHRSRVFSAAYHPTAALASQFVSGGWDNTRTHMRNAPLHSASPLPAPTSGSCRLFLPGLLFLRLFRAHVYSRVSARGRLATGRRAKAHVGCGARASQALCSPPVACEQRQCAHRCVYVCAQCTSGTTACGTRRAACTGRTCAARTRWTSTRATRRVRRSGTS